MVVDASVAVKWILNEEWSSESLRLLEDPYELSAPDHLIVEVANVVWKNHQRGEISRLEASERAVFIQQMNVRLASSADLVPGAMTIACERLIAVYDALYVQLAATANISLVTVDDHLLRKLEGSTLRGSVVHLRELWPEDAGNSEAVKLEKP